MTREEAIEYAESKKMRLEALVYNDDCKYGNYAMYSGELSFVNAALTALRPVSREPVTLCKDCRYWQGNNGGYPHPECRWGNDETPDADDYCSFAERMEVNKNG